MIGKRKTSELRVEVGAFWMDKRKCWGSDQLGHSSTSCHSASILNLSTSFPSPISNPAFTLTAAVFHFSTASIRASSRATWSS